MTLSEQIAANIQEARLARGWSQETLAFKCRPPTVQQQIDKLEKCERRLSLDWIERIAYALEIDPLRLLVRGSGHGRHDIDD
jgi:ribosome-binding protein aMBF1 (putative translation factor)